MNLKTSLKVQDFVHGRKLEILKYVLAKWALFRGSVIRHCDASCGQEAHSKMQTEDCPPNENQSRLSMQDGLENPTVIQVSQITRPQHSSR